MLTFQMAMILMMNDKIDQEDMKMLLNYFKKIDLIIIIKIECQ